MSKVSIYTSIEASLLIFLRCLAPKDDIDCSDQSYRYQEHTEILLDAWPTHKLWDEYGVVDNVKVSDLLLLLHRTQRLSSLINS